jgi:hypothetical protein
VFVRCFYGSAPGNRFSYIALLGKFLFILVSGVEVNYCRVCIYEYGAFSLSLPLSPSVSQLLLSWSGAGGCPRLTSRLPANIFSGQI